MAPQQIEREVDIDAPIERVWQLITEAEHLGRWFGDAGAEVDLRPGGEMALTWTGHGTVRGVVEHVAAPTTFAFRWSRTPDVAPAAGHTTRVEFSLQPAGGGTRLRVVESGFDVLEIAEDERVAMYDDHTQGWVHELGELAEHAVAVRR